MAALSLKTSDLKIEKDGKYQVMWREQVKGSNIIAQEVWKNLLAGMHVIRAMGKLLRL
jgi:hypothetical protein